jgi:photosystem II stability/assembly factor-like uncharacterized protein
MSALQNLAQALRPSRLTLLLASAITIGATVVQPAAAGQGRWTSLGGPVGGGVSRLAIDPSAANTFYASILGAGLFKSSDCGAHWTALRDGLPPTALPSVLAIDPRNPLRVYAAFDLPSGVFRTDDGGATWTLLAGGPFDPALGPLTPTLSGMLFSPVDPVVVYASSAEGFFRSADGATTWQLQKKRSDLPFEPTNINFMTVDPGNGNMVFVGSFQNVFLSRDGGVTWVERDSGLAYSDDYVRGLVFDPQPGGRLFAWTTYHGVFSSQDGGASWRPAGLADALGLQGSGYMWGMALSADGKRLYAAVSRSELYTPLINQLYVREFGVATWHLAGPPMTFWPSFLVASPSDPAELYAGTAGDGLARSKDGGATWSTLYQGLNAGAIRYLTADPRLLPVVYAIDWAQRLWRSPDSGTSWQLMSGGVAGLLAIDPDRPHTLYSFLYTEGLSRSDDGGQNWTPLPLSGKDQNLFYCQYAQNLLIDPLADSTLYLLAQGDDSIVCQNPGSFVYKSIDRGRTWKAVPEPTSAVYDLATGVQHSEPAISLLFALTTEGVERSLDGGSTWTKSTPGLGQLRGTAASMAVSADSRVLYLNSFAGVSVR